MVEYYETSDGRAFMLAIINAPREWPLLVAALGRPEWLDDPLFASPLSRFQNADLLTALLSEIFAAEPWSVWDRRLSEAGITFGLVGRITDHPSDPQLDANHLLPEFVDGLGLKTLDSPFQVVGVAKAPPRMAPAIGQHTDQILEEFGGADASAAQSA
jgi:formyl-CoA transferase